MNILDQYTPVETYCRVHRLDMISFFIQTSILILFSLTIVPGDFHKTRGGYSSSYRSGKLDGGR